MRQLDPGQADCALWCRAPGRWRCVIGCLLSDSFARNPPGSRSMPRNNPPQPPSLAEHPPFVLLDGGRWRRSWKRAAAIVRTACGQGESCSRQQTTQPTYDGAPRLLPRPARRWRSTASYQAAPAGNAAARSLDEAQVSDRSSAKASDAGSPGAAEAYLAETRQAGALLRLFRIGPGRTAPSAADSLRVIAYGDYPTQRRRNVRAFHRPRVEKHLLDAGCPICWPVKRCEFRRDMKALAGR